MAGRIYVFAGDVERDLLRLRGRLGKRGRTALHRDLDHDLGLLAGLLGDHDDVVLCEAPAEEGAALRAHVDTLRQRGLRCAEPLARPEGEALAQSELPSAARAPAPSDLDAGLRPWGWSPRLVERLRPVLQARDVDPTARLQTALAAADKAHTAALRQALAPLGVRDDGALFGQSGALLDCWAQAEAAGEALVVKARFGGSGRDAIRLLPGRGEPTAAQRGWIERTLREQGSVRVERWWPRRGDLGLLLVPLPRTAAEPRFGLLPAHRSHCDERGQFRGVALSGWDANHRRPPASDARAALDRVGQAAATLLQELGYVGPAGVDLIEREGDAVPLPVELNARHTMGHVGHALGRAMPPGAQGWLWIAPRGEQAELRALAGPEGTIVALTPPELARRVVAWQVMRRVHDRDFD